MGFDRTIDFLPDAKHLSVMLKSAFADILDESASGNEARSHT